ncbi:MAG: hypothetical protein KatS3mg102_2277 [Planctomycetota bacterium]|nr:MAG: hypothetical protein KatS3mg102_2277 [Planctomycetota bacterium]
MVLAILTVAIIGTVAAMGTVARQNQSSIETAVATQWIRAKLEEMRAHPYETLWESYTTGGTPGPTFTVSGLNPPAAGVPHGTVVFLGEPAVTQQWGAEVDLNDDGSTSSPPPASAAEAEAWSALPVLVRVRWSDHAGENTRLVELISIIYDPNQD